MPRPADAPNQPTTRTPGEPGADQETSRVARPEPFLGPPDDFEPIDPSTTDDRAEDNDADRPRAYSATTTIDEAVPEEPVPPRSRSEAARPSRTAAASRRPTNRTAIWALVLSILGITAPIGLYLGYRARSSIARTRELGEPFARVAIWLGWLYVVVFVLALITYFWIAGQGS
ncbi:DUF4190 domain-containing protein [Gordonia insulae]|uniref:DUF4190 domain-containing protein n=1 Tax=Gordonia insulae TaxID=2420509 RepID=A0A3G8JQ49_9ACTN|nr:DUF4190 domain-containing protein [Gordonia insulae]AZG47043.1 hypothetical protein D7316_03650 [Gordonia insulae]